MRLFKNEIEKRSDLIWFEVLCLQYLCLFVDCLLRNYSGQVVIGNLLIYSSWLSVSYVPAFVIIFEIENCQWVNIYFNMFLVMIWICWICNRIVIICIWICKLEYRIVFRWGWRSRSTGMRVSATKLINARLQTIAVWILFTFNMCLCGSCWQN